jgi:hypothetical protein
LSEAADFAAEFLLVLLAAGLLTLAVRTSTGAGAGSDRRVVARLGCRDFHFHLIFLLRKNTPARTMRTCRMLIRLSVTRLVNRDAQEKAHWQHVLHSGLLFI